MKATILEILKGLGRAEVVLDIDIHVPAHLKGAGVISTPHFVRVPFSDGSADLHLFLKNYNPINAEAARPQRLIEESVFFGKYVPRLRSCCQKHKG